MQVVCPSCLWVQSSDSIHECGHCGYPLNATVLIGEMRDRKNIFLVQDSSLSVLRSSGNQQICPLCWTHLPHNAHYCGHCGTALDMPSLIIKEAYEEQTLPLKKIYREIAARPLQEKIPQGLGWLPALSLMCAIGVFLVTLAYEAGRLTFPWADSLFWVGLLVLFLPVAWRILSSVPARQERILFLVMLGSALYFVKVLQYPLYFVSYDEFSH